MKSKNEFEVMWKIFFEATTELAKLKIKKSADINKKYMLSEPLSELSRTIIESSESFGTAILKEEPIVGRILFSEMSYFVERYQNIENLNSEELEGALDDAETVKGSIEDLVANLPDPLKKLLTLLNEFLKLISGGRL